MLKNVVKNGEKTEIVDLGREERADSDFRGDVCPLRGLESEGQRGPLTQHSCGVMPREGSREETS